MGIFSFVGDAVKSVTKGIGKVFKSVTKGISRIADSDWGRTLLVGAAIFTGSMAISGGVQGWGAAAAQGEGFLGKFVGGAEGFVTALASPIDQANKLIAGDRAMDPTAMAANASAAGKATGAIEQQAIARPDAGIGQPGALENAQTATQQAQAPPPSAISNAAAQDPAQKPEEKSWLEKAAGYAMDFVNSPAGASMISGYAEGQIREEEMKFEDRVRRSWKDPNNALAKLNQQGVGSRFISRGNIPAYNPGNSSVGTVATTGALPGEPVSPGVV